VQVEIKDPKFLVTAVLVLAGAVGGGSLLGLTIEPEEVTTMRVEKALVDAKVVDLEKDLATLKTRVDTLTDLVVDCRSVVRDTTAILEDGP
jgi:hypothetical protein